MAEAARLASGLSWNDDLEAMRRRIGDADLDRIAADVGGALADTQRQARTMLGCGGAAPDAGCDVTVRFLAQVIRTRPATEVFAQIVFAFHLARSNPSRIDLSHEYDRAVQTYGLTYADVKALSYNSVSYGFVPVGEKQALLAELERRFAVFEAEYPRQVDIAR